MYYNDVVEAIGHTPLIELKNINQNKNVKILAKLEGQNIGGSASTKDRIARYLIEKAEESGQLTPGKIIIEATSGNTGIALAWLGRKKGYKVSIVMPDNMSIERRRLIEVFGAELILTDGAYGVKGAIDTAMEMVAKDDSFYMPDQFSNPANPLAHYETTAVEIMEDNPYDKIDVLVSGIGTGGTIAGIARRLKEGYPDIRISGVEPPPNDIIQGLRCLEEYIPPVLDLNLLTDRAVVTSLQAEECARQLLNKEGIFAGLSSGATVYHALQVANQMEEGVIVVILADGGWKYLSMDFWIRSES